MLVCLFLLNISINPCFIYFYEVYFFIDIPIFTVIFFKKVGNRVGKSVRQLTHFSQKGGLEKCQSA